MSARFTRTRLLAATAVALASFALTACGDDDSDGGRDEGRAPAASESSTQSGDSGGSGDSGESNGSTDGTTDGSNPDPATNSENSSGSTDTPVDSDAKNPECNGSNTTTTATVVDRPLNHLLITVTNTGTTNCDLVGYPAVRFGEAQSVPPVDESTKPQAVVTLAPGESGYGGVLLSSADGSGENGYTTDALTVNFNSGESASPSLPAKGVYVDSSLQVTYWQFAMEDALN